LVWVYGSINLDIWIWWVYESINLDTWIWWVYESINLDIWIWDESDNSGWCAYNVWSDLDSFNILRSLILKNRTRVASYLKYLLCEEQPLAYCINWNTNTQIEARQECGKGKLTIWEFMFFFKHFPVRSSFMIYDRICN
jgi:hypothetical protein